MSTQLTEDVLALLSEETTLAAVAQRHGVTEEEVARWRRLYLDGARSTLKAQGLRRQAGRRARRTALVAGTAAVALLGAGVAWAQSGADWCVNKSLPTPLKTFCPNTPALAADVNDNFQTVYDWLAQKTGTPGSANVSTAGTLTVGGATLLNNTLTVSGNTTLGGSATLANGSLGLGATTRQMLNLYNTDYGLGVQASTQYFRSGNSFAWYKGGSHANGQFDPGTGGSTLATLDGGGNLNVAGQLSANTLRRRNCHWDGTGKGNGADDQWHEAFCHAGEYAAGWRCWANTYIDGDCAVYCCLP